MRRLGFRSVIRKIVSRLSERSRNSKFAYTGVGRVLAAANSSKTRKGELVLFLATNHSRAYSVVVVDDTFVASAENASDSDTTALKHGQASAQIQLPYIGWSPYSGIPIDAQAVREFLAFQMSCHIDEIARLKATTMETKTVSDRVSRVEADSSNCGRPTATIFGLGNYSKTQIVPIVRKFLSLEAVHEIDADQFDWPLVKRTTKDTSPQPREFESYDAWFVAGYHHTHAGIALHALKAYSYAVVEKPLATTMHDLNALERTIASAPMSKLFACYQRRYSVMNRWISADLPRLMECPRHYHCIVYETPLPDLHWYRWPNSGSRLVSNGCHWLDHFMSLNDYAKPELLTAERRQSGDYLVTAVLANRAEFTMILTDCGSEFLGVRDHVEIRAGNRTVRISDQANYHAETSARVLRRRIVKPSESYDAMYGEICRRIVQGLPGDSLSSLRSARAILDLEASL